tara:strand:- start:6219 stop:6440 length:222 start_codon:yes stop_codon:yes gene_type:complete
MIKNDQLLKNFKEDFLRNEGKLPYNKSITIFTGMWKEAVMLGVLPSKDPSQGLEVDIRVAKTLNSCLKKSFQG